MLATTVKRNRIKIENTAEAEAETFILMFYKLNAFAYNVLESAASNCISLIERLLLRLGTERNETIPDSAQTLPQPPNEHERASKSVQEQALCAPMTNVAKRDGNDFVRSFDFLTRSAAERRVEVRVRGAARPERRTKRDANTVSALAPALDRDVQLLVK